MPEFLAGVGTAGILILLGLWALVTFFGWPDD